MGANDSIRDGRDRVHSRYENKANAIVKGKPIAYMFSETDIHFVHITFESDLNRETLDGTEVERCRSTRAMRRLDSPKLHMPKTLCKEFELMGKRNGESICLLRIEKNRKRSYHIPVNEVLDELILLPKSSWGETANVPVISFDFN